MLPVTHWQDLLCNPCDGSCEPVQFVGVMSMNDVMLFVCA